jgi:hypothetical protein
MFDKMVGKVLQLDNNKSYQVIWAEEIDGRTFLYLLNVNDCSDPLFCERISDSYLEEINDQEFLRKVILTVAKDVNTFVL